MICVKNQSFDDFSDYRMPNYFFQKNTDVFEFM